MRFNRIIGMRGRLDDMCKFLLTATQIIECTRDGTLIKNGSGAFCYGIAKLEPSTGVVKGL